MISKVTDRHKIKLRKRDLVYAPEAKQEPISSSSLNRGDAFPNVSECCCRL